jgi:hypothetical protein
MVSIVTSDILDQALKELMEGLDVNVNFRTLRKLPVDETAG